MPDKPFALAVRALIIDGNGHVLLLKRSEHSKTNKSRWELPGGKMDSGESFDSCLKREVLEETGFTIEILHAAGTAEQVLPDWRVVHLVMVTRIISGGLSISSEHSAYTWARLEELEKLELADWFEDYYKTYLAYIGQSGG